MLARWSGGLGRFVRDVREHVVAETGPAKRVVSAMASAPVVALASLVGIGLVVALGWMQLRSLALPISAADGHHWRQSFTYGVAWNYAHTTNDVLRPRMFLELQRSNIVAMEAPLYPLLSSFFLRVSSSTVGPRLISWLSLVAIVHTLFRWLGMERSDPRTTWADRAGLFIALGLSPMIAVDFRSIQPEPLAAGLSMLAGACFVRYGDHERTRDAVLGAALTTLAILAKPLVIGIVPGLVLFAVWGRRRWLRRGLVVSGLLLLGLGLYVCWDRWASYLLKTEMDGTVVISIQHEPKEMLAHLNNPGFAREALLHFLPNFAGSWWLVPAFVAGVFRGFSERRQWRFAIPLAVWLAGYLVELLAFGDRLHSNAYYFILAPAPVAFFCALGLGGLVRALESPHHRPPVTAWRVALALAALLPMGFAFAKRTNWSSTAHADLGFGRNRLVWTSDLRVALLCVALLLAIAIGPHLRPRRVPGALGGALLLAILLSGVGAFRDARQYFGYYAGLDHRRGFDAELGRLRAAVDKLSDVDERVVVSSDEMVHFYYPLRNGFPASAVNTPAKLAHVRARGVRLYVHIDFEGGPSAPLVSGNVIAKGAWWRIYCIDAAGCSR